MSTKNWWRQSNSGLTKKQQHNTHTKHYHAFHKRLDFLLMNNKGPIILFIIFYLGTKEC